MISSCVVTFDHLELTWLCRGQCYVEAVYSNNNSIRCCWLELGGSFERFKRRGAFKETFIKSGRLGKSGRMFLAPVSVEERRLSAPLLKTLRQNFVWELKVYMFGAVRGAQVGGVYVECS